MKVGILLCRGDGYVPDRLPRGVESLVDRIDARVVGRNRVAVANGKGVLSGKPPVGLKHGYFVDPSKLVLKILSSISHNLIFGKV